MIWGFIRIYEIPDNLQKVPHDLICFESLNSMGFGNLATTLAYLENTKRAAKSSQTQSDKSSKIDSSKTNSLILDVQESQWKAVTRLIFHTFPYLPG